MASRPENIGIKAIEIYFPSQCVDQAELEKFDGVSQGKYTIGFGQTKMSFCDDREGRLLLDTPAFGQANIKSPQTSILLP